MDYFEEVKKLIIKLYDLEEDLVHEESLLEADLNITELDLEDLITQLEETYQLEIPLSVYSNFKQVSDISNYLYEHADEA
ncbi:MAG: acyl carrier protein [Candidatus Curtissbacteria bacterium]|nr:acyl carrier protein [Candidatus Curtissbacteria bacterium]